MKKQSAVAIDPLKGKFNCLMQIPTLWQKKKKKTYTFINNLSWTKTVLIFFHQLRLKSQPSFDFLRYLFISYTTAPSIMYIILYFFKDEIWFKRKMHMLFQKHYSESSFNTFANSHLISNSYGIFKKGFSNILIFDTFHISY